MKNLITILILFISVCGFSQNSEVIQAGQYAVKTSGNTTTVKHYTSGTTIYYYDTVATVSVVDTVFYLNASSDIDTTITRPTGKKMAILLKAGSTYSGTRTVDSDSTIYDRWGTGANPILKGSSLITGAWTLHEGNIYKTKLDSFTNQLYANGVKMVLAKTDSTDDQSFMYPITTVVNDSTFTCTDIIGTDFTGATVMGKWSPWDLRKHTVALCVPATGQITLDRNPSPTIQATYDDFFLANHISLLDEAGKWCIDIADTMLYFWTPDGTSPDNYVVEASTIHNAFYAYGVSDVTIKNISVKGFDDIGIKTRGFCNNITIDNCELNDNYLAAIGVCNAFPTFTHMADYLTVSNCVIAGSFGNGIIEHGDHATISNNSISNIGLFSDLGLSDLENELTHARLIGSYLYSAENSIVTNNSVENTGYSGLQQGGLNIVVSNNVVKKACLSLQDGGGIYTYSAENGVISNNIVSESGVGKTASYEAHGIYLDAGATGVTVQDNTVYGCLTSNSFGLFISHTSNSKITGNISYNNTQQILVRGNRVGIPVINDTIENNTFYSIYDSQITANYDIQDTALTTYILDGNGYYNAEKLNPISNGIYYTLSAWQTKTSQEASSTAFDTTMLYYDYEKTGVNILRNPTFDSDVASWSMAGATASWDASKLDDGTLKLSDGGNLSQGNDGGADSLFILEFDGIADVSVSGDIWLQSKSTGSYSIGTSRQHFSYIKEKNWTGTFVTFLMSAVSDTAFYFDNFWLGAITGTEILGTEKNRLVVNESDSTQYYNLQLYNDLSGVQGGSNVAFPAKTGGVYVLR